LTARAYDKKPYTPYSYLGLSAMERPLFVDPGRCHIALLFPVRYYGLAGLFERTPWNAG